MLIIIRPAQALSLLFATALTFPLNGCDGRGKAPERPQPYVSMPGPDDCLKDASLSDLEKKDAKDLGRLVIHYTDCQDDIDVMRSAKKAIYHELYRRGDPSAALSLSHFYKYSQPDRGKSVRYGQEALKNGDTEALEILSQWEGATPVGK